MKNKKNYKKLYENLSSRICRLHEFATKLSTGGITNGNDTIDRNMVSRELRKIAFGQEN